MASANAGDVTLLLNEVRDGMPGAADRLMARVYQELRRLAGSKVRGRDATDPTGLVNEAYLKLFSASRAGSGYENRRHFFWAAAQAMRDILVDDARRARAQKRHVVWEGADLGQQPGKSLGVDQIDLLALNEAIKQLEARHPHTARIVILRFFAGLTRDEVAAQLEVSEAAVSREWRYAKAWLLAEMEGKPAPGD